MAAITYGANSSAAKTATGPKAAPKRKNIFRLLFEAFIEARQLQAEMEIRRYYGHRLPAQIADQPADKTS
jgi:hypothetical protein